MRSALPLFFIVKVPRALQPVWAGLVRLLLSEQGVAALNVPSSGVDEVPQDSGVIDELQHSRVAQVAVAPALVGHACGLHTGELLTHQHGLEHRVAMLWAATHYTITACEMAKGGT